jgi:predicted GNAT family acetyltransferase
LGAPLGRIGDTRNAMASSTPTGAQIADVPDHSRYEVRVDGEPAGFAEYRRRRDLIAFTHTLIDPRFEGHGLATQLIQTALDRARTEGLAVLPFCPFVRAYIADHTDEYLDLVPATLRSNFDLPPIPDA